MNVLLFKGDSIYLEFVHQQTIARIQYITSKSNVLYVNWSTLNVVICITCYFQPETLTRLEDQYQACLSISLITVMPYQHEVNHIYITSTRIKINVMSSRDHLFVCKQSDTHIPLRG